MSTIIANNEKELADMFAESVNRYVKLSWMSRTPVCRYYLCKSESFRDKCESCDKYANCIDPKSQSEYTKQATAEGKRLLNMVVANSDIFYAALNAKHEDE